MSGLLSRRDVQEFHVSLMTKSCKSPLGSDTARVDLVVPMKAEAGITDKLSSFVVVVVVVVVTKKGITLTCWSRAEGPGLRVWGPAAGTLF